MAYEFLQQRQHCVHHWALLSSWIQTQGLPPPPAPATELHGHLQEGGWSARHRSLGAWRPGFSPELCHFLCDPWSLCSGTLLWLPDTENRQSKGEVLGPNC